MGRHLDVERTRVPGWVRRIPASVVDAAYDCGVLVAALAALIALTAAWRPVVTAVLSAAGVVLVVRAMLQRDR